MLPFLVRRIAIALLTLVTVSVITFWLFFAVPVDPAALQCGKQCTEAQLSQIRTGLGLDRPTHTLYFEYMKGLFAGRTIGRGEFARECPAPCLGYSFRTGEPVLAMVERAVPVSFSLVIGAAFIWIGGGVALGVLSALKRGTWLDRTAIGISLFGASTQIYFVGLILQLFLVFDLHLLPVPSYVSPRESLVGWASGLVLAWFLLSPVVALILALFALPLALLLAALALPVGLFLALLGGVLALLGFFVKWLLPLALLLLALWLLLSPKRPVPEGW